MEKVVKVVTQSPVFEIEVTDQITQQKKQLLVVELEMTDGLDTFVAEMRGERCKELPQLANYVCRASVTLSVKEIKTQDGRVRKFNTLTLNRIVAL